MDLAIAHRLLWVNHFAVPPAVGGGTRHVEIGRELNEMGWRVTIVASDLNLHSRAYMRREGAKDRRVLSETTDKVELRWVWAAPYSRNDWRRVWNWLSFARSLIADRGGPGRPDVVIGSSPHLFAALAAARLAGRWGVPFVLEVRDLWPESMLAAGGKKGPVYHVFEKIACYLYRRADRIICLARGTMTHLQGLGVDPGKLVYVPNGVDPAAFPDRQWPHRDTFAPA